MKTYPPLAFWNPRQRTKDMRHFFGGIAIIAALAIPTLASAQRTSPGAYADTGSGPGVVPPGGYGPSSPMFNLTAGSPGLPSAASRGTAQAPSITAPPVPNTIRPSVYLRSP
jgi:hypothetical protein